MSTNNHNQTTQLISFSLFCQKLSELCRTMATGTLCFVSPENRAGQFVLNDGQIVGVVYACKKGKDALASLESVPSVTYQFVQRAIFESQVQSLPTTQEILSQLYNYQTDQEGEERGRNMFFQRNRVEEESHNKIASSSAMLISGRQRKALDDLTTNYLGPLAKVMVDKLLHQATNSQNLIQLLKQRISDPQEAQTFERQAEQVLL